MLELVVIDLGAGIGDQRVVAAAVGDAHALAEQRAIPALRELGRTGADLAMLGDRPVAQLGEDGVLLPALAAMRVELGHAVRADRIVDIGEGDQMGELLVQPFQQVADAVARHLDVHPGEDFEHLGQRPHDDAPVVEIADAGALELLEHLQFEPAQIGFDRADRRIPIGADHLRLARE